MSLSSKIKACIHLVRPFTLLAPMIATISGILMSMLYHSEPHRFFENGHVVVLAAIAMALAQMCGQVINQSEDPVELDILNNKSYRPIPQRKISLSSARKIGILAGILALASAFAVRLVFGFGIFIILFFAVFYSIEPIRAKKRKILGTLWLGASRGFLPLLMAWSIFYSPFETVPIALSLVLFFWVSGFQITKDFPDIKGDKQFGILTFPVVYGVEKSKKFMQAMNMLAFGTLALYLATHVLNRSFSLVLAFFPVGTLVIHGISEKPKKLKSVENSPEWMFFYFGLGLLYILFTIALAIP